MAEAGVTTEFDLSGKTLEFTPAKLNLSEVVSKTEQLQPGEILNIAGSTEIVNIGGKKLLIDAAIIGQETPTKEKNKLTGPGTTRGDAFKSEKDESIYKHFMIDAPAEGPKDTSSQVNRIGKALAPQIDAILISHLDGDHFDFELIRTILENNPNAVVYGPLGWKKFVLRQHDREGKPSTGKPILPEKLLERIHSLTPKRIGDRVSPAEFIIPSKTKLGKQLTISSIDVPHLGAPQNVEMTQGFLLESDKDRILMLSTDPTLSPEVITHIKTLHREKPLTHVMVAGATFNPETVYGISPRRMADWGRGKIEEGLAHSAFLPVVIEALTDGKVPIDIIHHSFYFRSSGDRKFLNFRLPAQTKGGEPSQQWFKRLNQHIDQLLATNEAEVARLDRLALGLKHNLLKRKNPLKFVQDTKFRLRFANNIVNWIKDAKVPQAIIDHLGMPQPGEVIKPAAPQEYPQPLAPAWRPVESIQPGR